MKRKIIIVSLAILIVLINTVGLTLHQIKSKNVDSQKNQEQLRTDVIQEEKLEDEILEDQPVNEVVEETKIEDKKKVNNKNTKETKKEQVNGQRINTSNSNNLSSNNNNIKDANQGQILSDEQNQEKQNNPTKQTAWERLGLTEYEYYNEPYPKGVKVDFPLSSCGNLSNCYDECRKKGNSYGEGYQYECGEIITASGKQLGLALDVIKIQ